MKTPITFFKNQPDFDAPRGLAITGCNQSP
jgi:hypothetical protein